MQSKGCHDGVTPGLHMMPKARIVAGAITIRRLAERAELERYRQRDRESAARARAAKTARIRKALGVAYDSIQARLEAMEVWERSEELMEHIELKGAEYFGLTRIPYIGTIREYVYARNSGLEPPHGSGKGRQDGGD